MGVCDAPHTRVKIESKIPSMGGTWCQRLLVSVATLSAAIATGAPTSGQEHQPSSGVTVDRVAKLNRTLTEERRSFQRDPRTGYLRPVLEALGVPRTGH